MNDQPDKEREELEAQPIGVGEESEELEAEVLRAEDEEGQGEELREITEEDLFEILQAHERWRASVGREGCKANLRLADLEQEDLWGANLQQADLQGAYLCEADLSNATLQEANLLAADLQGANLSDANLSIAILRGSNLQGASLIKANLQNSNFWEASLEGANFLLANLKGAVLRVARLNGANLTYADLRNADLSDAKLSDVTGLLSGNLAGANLSNAKLPPDIAKFDALDHVAEISKHARTIFLTVVGGCVYSWLTIATTTDVALVVNSASTPLPIIQTKVPIAGFYWAAPLILLALFFYLHIYMQRMWEGLASLPAIFPDGRTLDRKAYPWLLTGLVCAHVPLLTQDRPALWGWQFALSIVAAWFLVPITIFLFWVRYLPRHEWFGTNILTLSLFVSIWAGCAFYDRARSTLRGEDQEEAPINTFLGAIPALLLAVFMGVIAYSSYHVDRRLELPGIAFYANLVEADISTKPTNWTGLAERPRQQLKENLDLLEKAKAELAQVKGVTLEGANLRGAEAVGAFLVKADLRGANLQEADLGGANLQEADLRGAKLQKAHLGAANFQGARLGEAKLQGAVLILADLEEANLSFANLQQARIIGARLQEANLNFANLQEAVLVGAKLQGANLVEAKLQGANLGGAILQDGDLRRADLQGAVLHKATLQKANLSAAKNLTQAQLDTACGDETTKLPPGLTIKPCPEEQ